MRNLRSHFPFQNQGEGWRGHNEKKLCAIKPCLQLQLCLITQIKYSISEGQLPVFLYSVRYKPSNSVIFIFKYNLIVTQMSVT